MVGYFFMQGLSIACSTPEAIAWDESWANTHEISGRAMKAVHDYGTDFEVRKSEAKANGVMNGKAWALFQWTIPDSLTFDKPYVCIISF